MTAAHKRHPTAATNGAGHGKASSSGQRGTAGGPAAGVRGMRFESISRFHPGISGYPG
jgi:hypothetical protein